MSETNGEHAARMLKSRLAARTLTRLGLRYVSTDELTIRRKRIGDKFTFVSASGGTIRDVNLQSLYVGAGAAASGTLAVPGVRIFAHLADAYFAPQAAERVHQYRRGQPGRGTADRLGRILLGPPVVNPAAAGVRPDEVMF